MNSRKWAGIRVKIHPLFGLVAIAGALTGQFLELITLFTIVFIHELGHVFAALAVGWRVVSMELLPFGGVAKVEEWGSTRAKDEVIVALAGPFMNVAMILLGYLMLKMGLWTPEWSHFFISGNFIIACFNLLPIWPLDGGKVLQALLSKWLPYYQTIYFSVIWSFIGILILLSISMLLPFTWNLIVLCLYLLLENKVAWKQAQYQFIRFLLMKKGLSSKSPSSLPVLTYSLHPTVSVGEAVKLLKKGAIHSFHVFDHQKNRMVILTEDILLTAFFEKNPRRHISELLSIG